MESLQINRRRDHKDLGRPASPGPDDLHLKRFEPRHDFVDARAHVVKSLARDEMLAQCDVRMMGGVESEAATPGAVKPSVQTFSDGASLGREQDGDIERESHHR